MPRMMTRLILLCAALAAAPLLGRAGLLVQQHGAAGRVAQLAHHRVELVAMPIVGHPFAPGRAVMHVEHVVAGRPELEAHRAVGVVGRRDDVEVVVGGVVELGEDRRHADAAVADALLCGF